MRARAATLAVWLCASLRGGAGAKQVRWFASNLNATLAMVNAYRGSVTGFYPGFAGAGMDDGGNFLPAYKSSGPAGQVALPCDASGKALAPYGWATAFRPLGLTLAPLFGVSPIALLNGTADRAIPALVACARATRITGVMANFESYGPAAHKYAPVKTVFALASLYTAWAQRLGQALHAANLTLALTISDYGILGEYDAGYASPHIDSLMSMATYYNMAPASPSCAICPLSKWEDRRFLWARWLLDPQAVGVRAGAMSAGIGQMTVKGCGCKNGTAGCCDFISKPLTDKAPAAQPSNFPAGRPAAGCHSLGCNGNCFFWTATDLKEFVAWSASVAKVGAIDVYPADFNALGAGTAPYYYEVLAAFLKTTP